MPDTDSSFEEIELETEDRMDKSIEALQRDVANIRSGRAATSMVEHLQVDYYGASTPLIQLASLSVPEARTILINPYDKGAMSDIEKAILKSDLNLTPQNDGSVIRLVLPDLSMDRRKELVKQLKVRAEEARVSIRNVRRDGNEHIKKLSGKSEDELKASQERIQKLTDQHIHRIDQIVEKKEKDILTV